MAGMGSGKVEPGLRLGFREEGSGSGEVPRAPLVPTEKVEAGDRSQGQKWRQLGEGPGRRWGEGGTPGAETVLVACQRWGQS